MKTKIKSRIITFVAAMLFTMTGTLEVVGSKAYAGVKGPEILITEVMPMSQSNNDVYEYIELYNNSDNNIDLKNYALPYQNVDITTSKIIPPNGVLVVCMRSTTTLESFNEFYGTSLTSDKYLTLPLMSEVLKSDTDTNIVLARDDGSVIVRARYNKLDCEVKKSITYKYSQSGFDMNKLGKKQTPTPGSITSAQVPDGGVRVTDINLDKSVVTMDVNQTAALYATVVPATATNKSVSWASSNPTVVQVNSKGVLTAKKNGSAVITVKTSDGGYTASCAVIVKKIPVTGISLNRTSISLDRGDAVILTASISPENATNKSIVWSSSNNIVATVDSNGLVVAKYQGTAVITAKTADGNYAAACTVLVNKVDGNVSVTGVSLNKTNITMKTEDVIIIEARVKPSSATNKDVTWSSSNTNVASVDEYGIVMAKQAGKSRITVKTEDGGYTASCLVTVSDEENNNIPVTDVRLNSRIIEMEEGENEKLTATVYPTNAYDKSVTWSSYCSSVASVDDNGNISALKEGITLITVTTADGKHKDICVVIVRDNENGYGKVTSVRLNKSLIYIKKGKFEQVRAIIIPGNAYDKTVTWESSDNNVAKITSDGKIVGLHEGYAVITVTTKDGKYTAECIVYVLGESKHGNVFSW